MFDFQHYFPFSNAKMRFPFSTSSNFNQNTPLIVVHIKNSKLYATEIQLNRNIENFGEKMCEEIERSRNFFEGKSL